MEPSRKLFWMQTFAAFALVWQWFEPSPERAAVYDAALSDLSLDQLRTGVARVLANATSKESPTPGDIRTGALGAVTWTTTRHRITGEVTGRERVRHHDAEIPAPAGLRRLLGDPDPGRNALDLPGPAGALVARTAEGMTPEPRRGRQSDDDRLRRLLA